MKYGFYVWGLDRARGAPTTAALPIPGKGKVEHCKGPINECPGCNLSELVCARREIARVVTGHMGERL